MAENFIKKEENFVCEYCGAKVKGTGYTNHCPRCLWSKHVDINPGDRANICGGLMPPVSFSVASGGYDLIHECQICVARKKNQVVAGDNLEILASL